jgi:site-specific recombinase XerD
MTNFTELVPVPCDPAAPFTDRLRLAVTAYLARFKGSSREHTESDLRSYLAWCAERARMDRHAATRRLRHLAQHAGVRITRPHPHMLRHTFVTTMLDAGVDLRDVQIAAQHADPRTTKRYDRARENLDRHPNYILAAYMASGT